MKLLINTFAYFFTSTVTFFQLTACDTSNQTTVSVNDETTAREVVFVILLPEFEPVPYSTLDNGRMWTFEYAPDEYFAEIHYFDPDSV